MNNSRLLQQMVGLVIVMILLSGCSGALLGPTPTSTPVPPTATSTPIPPTVTPTPAPAPKSGLWLGDHKISFTVTETGAIKDFRIDLGGCTITSNDEILIVSNDKFGSFAINPDKVFQGNDVATGSDFSATASFESDTTVNGTYSVQICGGMMFLSGGNSTWTANWQEQ